MKNGFALVLWFVVSGCVAHVDLPKLPARDASLAEREEAFAALSPVKDDEPSLAGFAYPRFILLNNGLRVMDPIDLLPAVDPTSSTALFARAATEKARSSRIAYGVAFGMEAVGLGLMLSALAMDDSRPGVPPSTATLGLLLGGAGVGLLSLIPAIIGFVLQWDAGVEQRSAFLMYPKDLRRTLGLGEQSSTAVP